MAVASSRFVYTRRAVLGWAGAGVLATIGVRTGGVAARQATPDGTRTGFLDPDLVHEIAVTVDQAVYDAMIETFASSGDKEWIEATVTIDGAAYERVGIRLKGNSSLGSLRMPGGPGGGGRETAAEGDSTDMPSAETPERLPWLLQLDRFVDGQQHEGLTELVVRSNHSATSLNEAVALALLDRAGLASQQAVATRFTVNGSDPALRLTIEHPDERWMLAHFPAGGLLYKAEAGGDFSYRGDDPDAYKDVFDLEAGGSGDDAADVQPLIDFLVFLDDTDDETFAAQIGDRLDLDGFATYLAMMNLLDNFDDISGPGNNAYLHVAPPSTTFTVIPWDMNLAFGGGGLVIREDGATPRAPGDLPDVPPGASVQLAPEGTPGAGPIFEGGGPGGPFPGRPNQLVARCEAIDGFTARVDEARNRLIDTVFASGAAAEVLARWVGVLKEQAADMVDAGTVTAEADAIAGYFTQEP